MSDALEQASLIMVPSGYENGTLGSLKPLDGTGDFTFTRGSDISATRVNEQGYIEKGYENLLLQSNSFDTTWQQSGTTRTSGQTGYYGTNDAWLLNKNLSQAFLFQGVTFSGVQTISIYAKAGSLNWVLVGSSIYGGYFDLFNGVEGSSIGNAISTKITPVGDGWYRCEVSGIHNITTSFRVYPADGDLDTSGTSGSIYIQDAMLNQGLVAYPYVETTTAPVAGGILEDMPRLDYSGSCPALLLELQRTNLIRHSEYFLGENNWFGGLGLTFGYDSSILNPENYYGCTTAIGNHLKRYSVINGVSVGTKLSYSIFAKSNSNANFTFGGIAGEESATFNINAGTLISQGSSVDSYDIVDYSNGWRKYVVNTTFQDAIGNGQVYVNISWNDAIEPAYLYGLQLEQDATYPTSYIPTYGVSQTRLKDVCVDAGNVNTFNSVEGVLFLEASALFDDLTRRHISISDGSTANRVVLRYDSNSNSVQFFVQVGGIIPVSLYSTNYTTTDNLKMAVKYKSGDYKLYVNGQIEDSSTDVSAINPNTLDTFEFARGIGSQNFYGKAKQVLYFPTALSDDECKALTYVPPVEP